MTEAVDSVLKQTYGNIELIVVDDASDDGSQKVIRDNYGNHPKITLILLTKNIGNCKAFNLAYKKSKGEYLIDLAADDILMPLRIEQGVKEFIKRGVNFGVNFSNAEIINSEGGCIKYFYPIDERGKTDKDIPEGDVFLALLRTYFICPPTMMYKSDVLKQLGGYDEELTYEDFDFWIRSSRICHYCFTNEVLVKKRVLKNSKSHNQFKLLSKDTISTRMVLKKAKSLVQNDQERKQLRGRVLYETRKALQRIQIGEALELVRLYLKV